MKKASVVLTICLFILFCLHGQTFAKTKSKKPTKTSRKSSKELVTAQSAIIVDLNKNKVIYSKSIHAKHAPASTVKILTALVALEKLGSNSPVEISKKASRVEPTKVWLREDAVFNSLDLINAVLISSANDASVAVAEASSGSESEFAEIMNKKARSLGAKNSNFVNASGLSSSNQYTTAYDLYKIAKAAFNNPVIYEIMKKKREAIKGSLGKSIVLVNHNRLLFKQPYPLVLVKTGYTRKARHCYAGIAYFDNRKFAIVILESKSPWQDIENLLGFIKKILKT